MIRKATISADGLYRYDLVRRWDSLFAEGADRWMVFIMLNPSLADAARDDNTIRRCISFATREGFGGLAVVNRFAYRTPYPAELVTARKRGADVVGPENAWHWEQWIDRADCIVAAWGANPALERLPPPVGLPAEVWCLGTTKDGHPRHPLYLGEDTKLERFTL